jgi:hypothetical protein
MRRLTKASVASLVTALAVGMVGTAPAMAEFGLNGFDVTFTNEDGSPAMAAGSHPFAMTTTFNVNTREDVKVGIVPDGEVKDLVVEQPIGFAGNPSATPRCSTADFFTKVAGDDQTARPSNCPDSTAVGAVAVHIIEPNTTKTAPVFNLVPTPGEAAKLGFVVASEPVTIDIGVRRGPPYNVSASLINIPQTVKFYGSKLVLWGNPSSSAHDPYRGHCLSISEGSFEEFQSRGNCPAGLLEKPFITLPRACPGPLITSYRADSWQNPGAFVEGQAETHNDSIPPSPLGTLECASVGFAPTIEAQPTSSRAESSSGLEFSLQVKDEELTVPTGTAQSDIKKVVATLPAGVTVNPSSANGLGACTKVAYDAEALDTIPGQGCPNSSKLGTVRVDTPLLENEPLEGSIFLAQPDDPSTPSAGVENPFDSLISLYVVIKNPSLGIIIKQAGKVDADPSTGQLVSTFDGIPQLPFSNFTLHFRQGPRAPLITPSGCGSYTTKAELTPWANPSKPVIATSTFQVSAGLDGGPCPSGGPLPFKPGFEAGSASNNAGSYSPFSMRLTRQDGEQEMTRFSSVLPPGVVGKLAGVSKCSDAAIAAAERKSGLEELAFPSCPANSRIGHILAGAGVGSVLTYVPGQVYLGGPFAGDPLSVVVITPAVAGPFDVGNVVTREALTLDPTTAEVQVNGAPSHPIPHILQGIPLKLRDLRVYVDRENFILNPTSCDPSAVKATLFGSFLDPFSSTDDSPAGLLSRYQAANCWRLPFKPKLALRLRGGTRRSDYPSLRAVLKARPADANIGAAVVTLPHSAFLAQEHIQTICTRVQFAANQCPKGAIYGRARAVTPLLDEPLEGPVYLRSSNHPLPDLVAALHGVVDINLVGRIDAVNARIRTNFASVPDAPVSKFVLEMKGGQKGLIVNSTNLCSGKGRADVRFVGQNGKALSVTPLVTNSCGKHPGKPHPRKTHREG